MIAAWRLVTRGLAVPAGACECALCGGSPHPAAKKVVEFLPAHFPHPDLIDPTRAMVCAGCVAIFGGKPSKITPPFRTRHVAVMADGTLRTHERVRELYQYLSAPESVALLSWAVSLKKHHLVHARAAVPGRLFVGSDNGTLEYGAAESALLPIVAELLAGFGLDTIIEGTYSSHQIQAFGASRWAALESRIEDLRRRSPSMLSLIVYSTPKQERLAGRAVRTDPRAERTDPMNAEDSAAAFLLGEIAHASAKRREDGLQFWGGFFLHRLNRFRRLDLDSLVSRLMAECAVAPHQAESVTSILREIEKEGMTAAVSEAIRQRPALLAALAYDHIQGKRVAK